MKKSTILFIFISVTFTICILSLVHFNNEIYRLEANNLEYQHKLRECNDFNNQRVEFLQMQIDYLYNEK